MAKLCSYYTLCPLIDQQSLLGVQKDADSGCAIVTLGRNIVIRYKLQDLKQVSSWSTKKRLTSQVVYDKKTNCYAAIFNEKYVRTWQKDEVDLDKVKGYKFNNAFHGILSSSDHSTVLIRQDGLTASLEWALENRKSWYLNTGILHNDEKIQDCTLITHVNSRIYLCFLTIVGTIYNYVIVNLREDTYLHNSDQITRIELKRTAEKLVGHVVLHDNNNAYLLTLWSHGRLYSYPLLTTCSDPPPGMLVSVLSFISTNNPVVMTPLNDTTIAIYGADVNEEGAVLVIYNTQFKLVQAMQKLKLYTKNAKLWQIDDKLLLAANRHLAIVPYRLAYQRIEAMLGWSLRSNSDKKILDEDNDIVEIRESVLANWQDFSLPNKLSTVRIPRAVSKQINLLVNEGNSDAAIQGIIIPKLIESKDISTILWCFDNLKDIPEKILIDLLLFGIRSTDQTFAPIQNGSSKPLNDAGKYISRDKFLDRIFRLNFSDFSILNHLKSTLSFDEALRLINYLLNKLSLTNEDDDKTDELCEKQLYEWISLVLDSHYQYYLLSKDTGVLDTLNKLSDILNDHMQVLKEIQDVRPLVQRIMSGKSLKSTRRNCSKFYSIEEVQLY